MDPDGSISNAALRERERREAEETRGQHIGSGDGGGDGDGDGRGGEGWGEGVDCSRGGAPIRSEDEENVGCPSNPNA